MNKENLVDAGEIVQTILTQPLSVPGAKGEISLIEAAKRFDPANPLVSDLRKMLLNFQQFPEATERMLNELELLLNEL